MRIHFAKGKSWRSLLAWLGTNTLAVIMLYYTFFGQLSIYTNAILKPLHSVEDFAVFDFNLLRLVVMVSAVSGGAAAAIVILAAETIAEHLAIELLPMPDDDPLMGKNVIDRQRTEGIDS